MSNDLIPLHQVNNINLFIHDEELFGFSKDFKKFLERLFPNKSVNICEKNAQIKNDGEFYLIVLSNPVMKFSAFVGARKNIDAAFADWMIWSGNILAHSYALGRNMLLLDARIFFDSAEKEWDRLANYLGGQAIDDIDDVKKLSSDELGVQVSDVALAYFVLNKDEHSRNILEKMNDFVFYSKKHLIKNKKIDEFLLNDNNKPRISAEKEANEVSSNDSEELISDLNKRIEVMQENIQIYLDFDAENMKKISDLEKENSELKKEISDVSVKKSEYESDRNKLLRMRNASQFREDVLAMQILHN